jgi:hypothetical protein
MKYEYEALVELYLFGKTRVLGDKPVPLPFCLPQILHGLAWAQASMVKG